MSRSAKVLAPFGDGKYTFQLDIAGLEELDELCDVGPEEQYTRIIEGRWRVKDIREPIRIGLVRGGTDPMRALALVSRYAAAGYLGGLKPLAMNILGAAILGSPEEDKDVPPGEMKGETSGLSPDESSASQPTTKSAQPSATRRAKSGAAPSGN
jgi:hypothetical protein